MASENTTTTATTTVGGTVPAAPQPQVLVAPQVAVTGPQQQQLGGELIHTVESIAFADEETEERPSGGVVGGGDWLMDDDGSPHRSPMTHLSSASLLARAPPERSLSIGGILPRDQSGLQSGSSTDFSPLLVEIQK